MKKIFGFLPMLLAVVAILAMAVSPASAFDDPGVPKAEEAETSWSLIMASVSFKASGGARIVFDVEGGIPPNLSTFAYAGWGAYPMYCGYNANQGQLICQIESGIRKHDSAYFELWGQPFTISVPEREPEPQPQQEPESEECQFEECVA